MVLNYTGDLVVEQGEHSRRSLPIDLVVDAIDFLTDVMQFLLVELKTVRNRVVVFDLTDNVTQYIRLFTPDSKKTDRQAV